MQHPCRGPFPTQQHSSSDAKEFLSPGLVSPYFYFLASLGGACRCRSYDFHNSILGLAAFVLPRLTPPTHSNRLTLSDSNQQRRTAMLSKQDNETLTRVGPAPLWASSCGSTGSQPSCPASSPGPDSDPVRVRLLGENLVAFRDTTGTVGLIDNYCPHRRASLFFGRNEESGIRCVYHGWKYDVSGNCVDMPSEPAESNFKDKVKITAYPCAGAQRRHLDLHGHLARSSRPCRTSSPTCAPTASTPSPLSCVSATGCRALRATSAPPTSASCTLAARTPRPWSPAPLTTTPSTSATPATTCWRRATA